MSRNPKSESPDLKEDKDVPAEEPSVEDQNSRGYYYDDAHGYEVYDPKDDDDSDT